MDMKNSSALVLVVDDDVRTARILVKMLREDGFEVELATDGATAIGRLARSPMPDLLVTDIRMPHVDGAAVARYARSRRQGLPVFVITSYPETTGSLGNTMNPAPLVFPKPLDYPSLLAGLRDALAAVGPPASLH